NVTITGATSGAEIKWEAAGPWNDTTIPSLVTISPGITDTEANVVVTVGTISSSAKRVSLVPIQMKLTLLKTEINHSTNYSEDSTIQITAVRADNGTTVTNFTGPVTIAEDLTAVPAYAEIYSQNSGYGAGLCKTPNADGTSTACSPANQVNI